MDEPAHLAGGLAYWSALDLRMNPENGLLPQAWATLALFLAGDRLAGRGRVDWQRPNGAYLGYELLYREGKDAERIKFLLIRTRSAFRRATR